MADKKQQIIDEVRSNLAMQNFQDLVAKLNVKCFAKCVVQPGTALDNSERRPATPDDLAEFVREQNPQLASYLRIWANFTHNQIGLTSSSFETFETLEQGLFKRFFLNTVDALATAHSTYPGDNGQALWILYENLVAQVGVLVKILLIVAKQYPVDDNDVEIPQHSAHDPPSDGISAPVARPFPVLPSELIRSILTEVAVDGLQSGLESSSTRTLSSCALVNKTWSKECMPLLYRRLKLHSAAPSFNLAFSRLLHSRVKKPRISADLYVREMEINCQDLWMAPKAVLETVHLVPNLAKLTLSAIEFDGCPINATDIDRPELVGAAHQNLQYVRFPDQTSDSIAVQFLARCSASLVAVDTGGARLRGEALGTIATKCTGLRALAVRDLDRVEVAGLISLLERHGQGLKCLVLESTWGGFLGTSCGPSCTVPPSKLSK
ncbi:hypothetical protein HK102_001828 [Quaeritorhiza haematococci]|nr:hypothetical protein HK102_001828 [Quaeritorhiza haematococci]